MVVAIGLLCSYSFLSKREDGDTYEMHRLVQLGMRIWLQQNAEMTVIQRQALMHVVEIFPSNDHVNRWIWREYLPHAS